ncbi:RNA polymerase sigma-28 factor [bioreactor metagenome]|uniref:RNA polymerase sigma-28 factor n=1 Tax=bioreactor metagenome TaxID=1076179 RepID=A0A645EVD6_9ZZZZ
MIEHNLRLVAHIIKKYYTSYKDQEDLISIGTIGLIKAIDTYDPENGTKFATYAGKCLQNEILMYFRSQKRLSAETSINDAIEFDKDGNPLTYLDIMYVEDDYAELVDMKTKVDQVKKIIVTDLDEREKNIIIMRYGLSGCRPVTQREAAEKLHISRSYVSRIEKAALEKIRRKIKS